MSMSVQNEVAIHIAYVISPHGFGHAARACAVMDAALRSRPGIVFDVFTQVPEWFFRDSLGEGYVYHPADTDIGVVQESPFQENLPATVAKIKAFLPFEGNASDGLAQDFARLGCVLAVSDAGPIGIRAAEKAGIPSVLVENFTWDWIYSGYVEIEPGFSDLLEAYRESFRVANYHVQTLPVCEPQKCDLTVPPVARRSIHTRQETRAALSIGADQQVVLITMGGIPQVYDALDGLSRQDTFTFVIPGGADRFQREGNLVLMPHHSDFYHPDLVYASDAVVGKLGYSTVAEAALAGIRYAYVPRDHFRETGPLGGFVEQNLAGMVISMADFFSGKWVDQLPAWMNRPAPITHFENGAGSIAYLLLELIERR